MRFLIAFIFAAFTTHAVALDAYYCGVDVPWDVEFVGDEAFIIRMHSQVRCDVEDSYLVCDDGAEIAFAIDDMQAVFGTGHWNIPVIMPRCDAAPA